MSNNTYTRRFDQQGNTWISDPYGGPTLITDPDDKLATKKYVDDNGGSVVIPPPNGGALYNNLGSLSSSTLLNLGSSDIIVNADINMLFHQINNVPSPIALGDATNKDYVDQEINNILPSGSAGDIVVLDSFGNLASSNKINTNVPSVLDITANTIITNDLSLGWFDTTSISKYMMRLNNVNNLVIGQDISPARSIRFQNNNNDIAVITSTGLSMLNDLFMNTNDIIDTGKIVIMNNNPIKWLNSLSLEKDMLRLDNSDNLIYGNELSITKGHIFKINSNDRFFIGNNSIFALVPVDMNNNLINNVLDPVNPQDAATKAYIDSIPFTSFDFHNNFGINCLDPVNPQDVATKNYVDINIPSPIGGILSWNSFNNLINGDFLLPGYGHSATEAVSVILAPSNMTLKNLTFRLVNAPGIGESRTITLNINSVAFLTVTINNNNVFNFDASSISVLHGQKITLFQIESGASVASIGYASIQIV